MHVMMARATGALALAAAVGLPRAAVAQDSLPRHFSRLVAAQYAAVAHADTGALARLWSDSLVWVIGASGAEATKQQLLAALVRPETPAPVYDVDSVRVSRLGEAVVVEYRRTDRRRVGATDLATRWRVLAVYTRSGGRWVLERHTQAWVVAPATPLPLDSAAQAPFVGRYAVGPGNIDEVYWRGGRLFARNGTEAVGPALVPVSGSAFSPNGTGALIVFERDTAGRVVGYVQGYPDGRVARAARLP
jgi:hypothetical protein